MKKGKGNADEKELDEQFLSLHNELFENCDSAEAEIAVNCFMEVFRNRISRKMLGR